MLAAACSSGPDAGLATTTTAPVATTSTSEQETTAFSDVATIEVSPETEDTIVLDDGATLTIAAGTVESSTTMSFGRIEGSEMAAGSTGGFDVEAAGFPALPEGLERASALYDFYAGGYGEFSKPVTITLSYDENAIPESVPETQVAAWTIGAGEWVPIPTEVDTESNTITFQKTHNQGGYL